MLYFLFKENIMTLLKILVTTFSLIISMNVTTANDTSPLSGLLGNVGEMKVNKQEMKNAINQLRAAGAIDAKTAMEAMKEIDKMSEKDVDKVNEAAKGLLNDPETLKKAQENIKLLEKNKQKQNHSH
jgi:hypothetical protein